jgi:hypothetical protein
MREKIEVGGPGAFDQVEDIAGVVKVMLTDQTPSEALELLDILRVEIEAFAASNATLIPTGEPIRHRPDEAEAALSICGRNGSGADLSQTIVVGRNLFTLCRLVFYLSRSTLSHGDRNDEDRLC